jgi:hypothetical protein
MVSTVWATSTTTGLQRKRYIENKNGSASITNDGFESCNFGDSYHQIANDERSLDYKSRFYGETLHVNYFIWCIYQSSEERPRVDGSYLGYPPGLGFFDFKYQTILSSILDKHRSDYRFL